MKQVTWPHDFLQNDCVLLLTQHSPITSATQSANGRAAAEGQPHMKRRHTKVSLWII